MHAPEYAGSRGRALVSVAIHSRHASTVPTCYTHEAAVHMHTHMSHAHAHAHVTCTRHMRTCHLGEGLRLGRLVWKT